MCELPILPKKGIFRPIKGDYRQGLIVSVDVSSHQRQGMVESSSVEVRVFDIYWPSLLVDSLLWYAHHQLLRQRYP